MLRRIFNIENLLILATFGLVGLLATFGLVGLLGMTAYNFSESLKHSYAKSDLELSKYSVAVVRSDKRSGGSGSVIKSSPSESLIITNNHVCGVIQNGGSVIKDGQEYVITKYKRSHFHDLCIVAVSANLGEALELAPGAPEFMSEAIVAGHPRLLPLLLTKGVFSEHEVIEVMIGLRQCTAEDLKNQDTAPLCMLIGGIPLIGRYEAQVISALIQPGSSGSPVLNKKGQLTGLVFAGSGDIGFGFIVPYQFVRNFILKESPSLEYTEVKTAKEFNPSGNNSEATDAAAIAQRIEMICSTPKNKQNPEVNRMCNAFGRDLLWKI